MKRIASAVPAMVLVLAALGTALTASAAGHAHTTPSGIAYSGIGSRIDSFIQEREAGLASCEVSVFDRDGVIYNGYYGYADIRTYLPDGFLTKLQYPDEKITMLDLMRHRAGFQESFYENQEAVPDDIFCRSQG